MSLPVPVSLLDRSRTRAGEPAATALHDSIARAQRVEELGLHRFWVAEHHAVPGIASGNPPVLMAEIAARTERIRVGSGGVMLPNHRPIVIAEQARMLAALHPGRIDLGIGRSLGFTAPVRDALGVHDYPTEQLADDLDALEGFLSDTGPVTAMPKGVPAPPVFLLATGSGLAVAAERGLPVVVGGPVLWGDLGPVEEYRERFVPSAACPEPYLVLSPEIMIGQTPSRARELALPEAWAMVESRTTGAFPPLRPEPAMRLTQRQQAKVEEHLGRTIHGASEQVEAELAALVARTGADEVLAWLSTHDRDAQDRADVALAAMAGT